MRGEGPSVCALTPFAAPANRHAAHTIPAGLHLFRMRPSPFPETKPAMHGVYNAPAPGTSCMCRNFPPPARACIGAGNVIRMRDTYVPASENDRPDRGDDRRP